MSRDLLAFRDYCRRMQADPADPDAWIWRQLADEIDAYLEPVGGLAPDLFGSFSEEPAPEE